MGNSISINQKKIIYNKLTLEYDNLKKQNLDSNQKFIKIMNKYTELMKIEVAEFNLDDINYGDGVIKTDTFTLIGWNDDTNNDIDIDELENTLKRNAEKDIN